MKKIFTLLFFAGFLATAAFAQDGGRHRQNDNQYNNDRNSSYGDRGDRNGYGNDQQWQDRRGEDRHDRDGWDRDHWDGWDRDHRDGWDGDHRGGWDRDHGLGFHRHYRDYDHDREVIAYPYGYSRPVASFQIIIGHRERH